jgi:hypothetical protein
LKTKNENSFQTVIFVDEKIEVMDSVEHSVVGNKGKNDVATSWVSTSRFLFYCQIAIAAALFIGMCYGLYANRYKGKPNVEIPANTHFNPSYK